MQRSRLFLAFAALGLTASALTAQAQYYPAPQRERPVFFLGEAHVDGGKAPSGRGPVDHVVVHKCARVQQLQRREQAQHLGVERIGIVGDRSPAPICERRAKSLTTAQDEFFERADQHAVVGADVGGIAASGAHVLAKLVGDGAGQLQR